MARENDGGRSVNGTPPSSGSPSGRQTGYGRSTSRAGQGRPAPTRGDGTLPGQAERAARAAARKAPDPRSIPASDSPAYPIGSGTAYTARPLGTTAPSVNGRQFSTHSKYGSLTRRQAVTVAAASIVGIGALATAGIGWWTHRAVACTVNGEPRVLPIGCSADEVIGRGFASPRAGNLVSICADGEKPQILTAGAGQPFTLAVNGEQVDLETYRLSENDALSFTNGSDIVEDVYEQATEIPCGIQLPDDSQYLSTIGYVQQWGRNGRSVIQTGLISGKTVDRGVVEPAQDLIIACGRINPADGRLLVALTFDDGPSLTYTPQFLDILAQYGAKATFFNLGCNIEEGEEYKALCRRCVEEGHQMASHTYSHDSITLTGMKEEARNEEIRRTFEIIGNVTGARTHVLRPPYGELRGKGFLQYLAHAGDISYSAHWSVDSLDWELPGVDAIVNNCTHGLNGDNYNGAVILMHDGGGNRDQGVQALPRIIATFQNAGYELVTMNEMIAADSSYPTWVSSGYVERPADAIIPDITPYITEKAAEKEGASEKEGDPGESDGSDE